MSCRKPGVFIIQIKQAVCAATALKIYNSPYHGLLEAPSQIKGNLRLSASVRPVLGSRPPIMIMKARVFDYVRNLCLEIQEIRKMPGINPGLIEGVFSLIFYL